MLIHGKKMELLELVVTERNRLMRYSAITSIVSLVLATWARDPLLNITTPFSGEEVGNITVGHAILIGQPIVCFLFFLLCAQISRYKNLAAQLPDEEREHLDWKYFAGNEKHGFMKFVHKACEFSKWFLMIGIPAFASFFLFASQFDLEVNKQKVSYRHLFNHDYFGKRPLRVQLRPVECKSGWSKSKKKDCEEQNIIRKKIGSRMPRLYQPFNFLGGLFLQILVVGGLWSMFKKYFLRKQATND